MISFLIVWVSTYFKSWFQLHEDIEGRWPAYLYNLFVLRRFQEANPKGRLELHNVWDNADFANAGLVPFDEEVVHCNPKQVSDLIWNILKLKNPIFK